MKIIILRDVYAASRSLDLASWRGRSLCGGIAAIGAALFGMAGFGLALAVSNPHDLTLTEVREMKSMIASQRATLADVEGESRRDTDALAVELGRLQAQATRLNALGDRLTQVGKIDDGEFDFSDNPALGGPEEPLAISASTPITEGIENLRAEFDRQQSQLEVLENLLLDRKVENALLPSEYPVVQGYIASGFGTRTDPITGQRGRHLGVDFDVPVGSSITSVAEGVVTYSGVRNGYGNVVEIDHGNGYMTRYAHNSKNLVDVGARVHIGEVIAKVGSTGRSTGPHCHFEVWLKGRPVNPIAYVRSTRAGRG